MQRLPTVCPALHELHVTIEHQYGVLSGRWARFRSSSDPVKPYPMESLQELSGLTSLTLAANDFCWVAQGVWQLTGLRKLRVAAWYAVRTSDVLGLTNLQRLTLLELGDGGELRLADKVRPVCSVAAALQL